MKRRLFNLLALLSFVLLVATVGVAVRGQFFSGGGNTFGPQNDTFTWRVSWRGDRVYTYWSPCYVTQFSIYAPGTTFVGVQVNRGNTRDGSPIVIATASPVHVWTLAALLAFLPLVYAGRRVRAARTPAPGACPRCGYDLRATPCRCPECGAAPGPADA
jgi:hypothetical protein